MKKKDNYLKVYVLIGIIYVIITFICDLLIKMDIVIPLLIHVNDSYADNIFSALCTVATLGSAILAIIIDILPNKYMGYTLKEIYHNKSFLSIKNTVAGSLASIIISILLLAFELFTTLTALLVLITLIIIYGSVDIWRLITEDKYGDDMIMKEIETTVSSSDYAAKHFEHLYPEMQLAFETNDEILQDRYIQLIHKVINNSKENKVNFQSAIEGV